MRVWIGPPPQDPDFRPELQGWTPLKEPSPWAFQLLAAPIGLLTLAALCVAWGLVASGALSLTFPLLALIGVIPIHELVHAAAHPGFGLRRASILGFWPSRLVFYAHFVDAMPRDRFLLILIMPLLVISVVPLACGLLSVVPGWVAVASVWNGLLSCGDILGMLLVAAQVPRTAVVRNRGWFTWWQDEGRSGGAGSPRQLLEPADRRG
jgi:Putative zincin peptidase